MSQRTVNVTVYLDDLRDSIDAAAPESDDQSKPLNELIHEVIGLYLGRKDSLVLVVDLEKKTVSL